MKRAGGVGVIRGLAESVGEIRGQVGVHGWDGGNWELSGVHREIGGQVGSVKGIGGSRQSPWVGSGEHLGFTSRIGGAGRVCGEEGED